MQEWHAVVLAETARIRTDEPENRRLPNNLRGKRTTTAAATMMMMMAKRNSGSENSSRTGQNFSRSFSYTLYLSKTPVLQPEARAFIPKISHRSLHCCLSNCIAVAGRQAGRQWSEQIILARKDYRNWRCRNKILKMMDVESGSRDCWQLVFSETEGCL